MIRVEEGNELVMDGELDEVVTEFGDIVNQYLRFMHDTHPIAGMAAEKSIIVSIILSGCKTLPPADKENTEEMNKAMVPMVEQIYESLKVPREYIKRKWKNKGLMKQKLYMITTRDKYELPIIVEDSATKLARRIGMNPNTLRSCISHGYRGYCRVEVDIEEGEAV